MSQTLRFIYMRPYRPYPHRDGGTRKAEGQLPSYILADVEKNLVPAPSNDQYSCKPPQILKASAAFAPV